MLLNIINQHIINTRTCTVIIRQCSYFLRQPLYNELMIKAVIFDCFGVLMVDAITAYQDLHPEIASDLDDLDRQADAGFISQAEQIEGYKKLTGDDEQTIVNYLRKEHRLNEPIVQMIKQLKVSYKVGMLSNIGAKWYQQLVPEDVRDLFDVTVLSHEIGMVKPSPEIFDCHIKKITNIFGYQLLIPLGANIA